MKIFLIVLLLVVVALLMTFVGDEQPHFSAKLSTTNLFGCEYLVYNEGFGQYHVFSMTHKGNCTNSIHESH